MREGRLATDLCSRRRSLVAQSLASFLSCLIDEYDSFQKSKAYGKKTFIDYPRAAEVVKGVCGAALKRTYFFEHLREHGRAPPLIEEPTNSRLKSWAKGVHDINEVSGEEVPMSDWADLKFAQKFVISLWVAVVPHEPGTRLHSRWPQTCGHCLKRLGRAQAWVRTSAFEFIAFSSVVGNYTSHMDPTWGRIDFPSLLGKQTGSTSQPGCLENVIPHPGGDCVTLWVGGWFPTQGKLVYWVYCINFSCKSSKEWSFGNSGTDNF